MALANCRLIITTALKVLLLLCVQLPAQAEQSTAAAVFEYHSAALGEIKIYASAVGVRIESQGTRTVVVARPPLWKVFTYSPVDKLINEQPLISYRRRNPPVNYESELNKHVVEERFMGLNTTRLVLQRRDEVHSMVGALDNNKVGSLITREYDYSYWTDARIAPQGRLVCNCTFLVPNYPGVLLQKYLIYEDGRRDQTVTLKSHKEESVPTSFFDPPKGYKSVNDPRLVLGGRIHDLEDIMRDMGVGDTFGKGKRH